MGVTKTDNFSDQQNQIALIAKVLGHPARIAILQHIMQQNSCICGDLVLEIGLAQATISQHLRELKNAGLIKGTIDGTSVCYCINTHNWNKSKDLLLAFLNQNETLNTLCC
jgi:ArsR family transcriptional regulator